VPVGVGFGLVARPAEFCAGAIPGAFESGDLTLHPYEEFGGGESERRAAAGMRRGFGQQGAVRSARHVAGGASPVGGAWYRGSSRRDWAEVAVVGGDEGVVVGGIFAMTMEAASMPCFRALKRRRTPRRSGVR
jgi:hypothetical protein